MPTQANRDISVTSALGADALLFEHMEGSERLGTLPEYRVRLLSQGATVDFKALLGKPMGVHLTLGDGSERHFHGIVTRFACIGWGATARYEAVIRPGLWLLTRSSDCRIFQNKSVVDIVKAVCEDGTYTGLFEIKVGALSGTYDPLPYCVQYRETDFAFVSRLLESVGIYYFFEYTADKHTMVLADSYGAHATIPGYATVNYAEATKDGFVGHEVVSSWMPSGAIESDSMVLNDFDFETALASASGGLRVTSSIAGTYGAGTYELYDYPGDYKTVGAGNALARARMESVHSQGDEITGVSNARGLAVGGLFSLAQHLHADQNCEVLVVGTQTTISAAGYASGGRSLEFSCRFTAVGIGGTYRPPRTHRKPVVQGPQTAMVVGKAGEEIWTDEYGRIKVQFHWDREGKDDETSSCWVRVQQAWAGKSWGTMFIPRIGMEVVVSFLEGDPDRPLVTGCVYNADAMPPYPLPTDQTKSTIKTNSSKGGAGFNEIRFEDKKDSEELFVQAEKDYNRVVKNNDTLKVGFEKADKGDQTIQIKNDQSSEIGNNQSIKVTKDRTLEVGGNQTAKVTGDDALTVSGNQTVKITGDQAITGSKTIVVEATTSIELKVGSSSIKIEPAKITIKSTQIAIEATAAAEFKAGAMMTVKAGAPMSIKSDAIVTMEGALVKIN